MGVYSRIHRRIAEKLHTPDSYMRILKTYSFFFRYFKRLFPVYLIYFFLLIVGTEYTSLISDENTGYAYIIFFILTIIYWISMLPLQFIDIFSSIIFPPNHIRPAFILEYVKEYLLTKGDTLSFKEKKNMSRYIFWAIDDIPQILKKSKIKYSELDEDLSSRFSSLEKDIADISKEVYFNKDSSYDKQIVRIDEISKILRERNFGELNIDPDYKAHKKEKIWQRLVDIKEFKKHTSKGLVYLIIALLLLVALVILEKANPEVYSDIIKTLSYQ